MGEYPNILVFDFSKASCGLAFGKAPAFPKLMTNATGDDTNLAGCAAAMLQWVPDLLTVVKPDVVFIEAAFSRHNAATRIAFGGDFMIKGFCAVHRVRCIEVNNKTWKARVLGSGNLNESESKKRSRALAAAFGMSVRNHDEADAFCIWLWAVITKTDFPSNKILEIIARQQFRLVA